VGLPTRSVPPARREDTPSGPFPKRGVSLKRSPPSSRPFKSVDTPRQAWAAARASRRGLSAGRASAGDGDEARPDEAPSKTDAARTDAAYAGEFAIRPNFKARVAARARADLQLVVDGERDLQECVAYETTGAAACADARRRRSVAGESCGALPGLDDGLFAGGSTTLRGRCGSGRHL
jgi:hypothetical protein